jgi:dTDP-4-dehydrorhamnose 3,5-epimerase
MYFSETQPGVARDEDRWHYHPGGQEDRFGMIKGDIVVALYDDRKESPTYQQLNLFLMGESQKDAGQYLLLIPPQVLHGFVVVSKQPAILINYPTRLYDPKEEQRIPFGEVKLKDGSTFSWEVIREHFK